MAALAMVVEVVTPEASLFAGPAEAVVLRSSDGDLTILPGHTPLVTDVRPGPVRVDLDGGTSERLAVHGGFLHVDTGARGAQEGSNEPDEAASTRVRLLAGVAELASHIDVERAERAKEEAEARLGELRGAASREVEVEGQPTDPEVASAEADLERAEVRLLVARGEDRGS